MASKARAVHYDTGLEERIARIAAGRGEGCSVNKMIVRLLTESVEREEAPPPPPPPPVEVPAALPEKLPAPSTRKKMAELRATVAAAQAANADLGQKLAYLTDLGNEKNKELEELKERTQELAKRVRELEAGRKILIENLATSDRARRELMTLPDAGVRFDPELLQAVGTLVKYRERSVEYLIAEFVAEGLRKNARLTESEAQGKPPTWVGRFLTVAVPLSVPRKGRRG